MGLTPLATVADLTARGVTVSESETAPVTTYLSVASSLVREAAGTPITETTSTIVLEGGHDKRLRLPGGPIRSVSAVDIDGDAVTDYRLSSGALWREIGWHAKHWTASYWRKRNEPSDVTVTYVHGLPTVPDDIVDLVCRLAGQALSQFRSGDPTARMVDSERIGDYQVRYSAAESGILSLSDYQRSRLAARFGAAPGMIVRSR